MRGVAIRRKRWQRERWAPLATDNQQHTATFQGGFSPQKRSDLHTTNPRNMARKRKEHRRPQKLTEFFTLQLHGGRQDGAGNTSTPAHSSHSLSVKSASISRNSWSPSSQQSYPNTPSLLALLRARRYNPKIREIPESVQQGDLREYTITLFKGILPELTDLDVTIDRIYRLPKPAYLPEQIPRDVILRLHFYHTKEEIMTVMCTKEHIHPQY